MQRGFLIALVALGCTRGDPTVETPSDAARRQEAFRWSNRGSLYLKQGRPARAVAALERATRLDSTAGGAHFNLGLAHARLEEHPAAVAAFEHALALEPDNPRVLFALGATLRSQHRYLEAAEHIERAITLNPDRAENHFELGQVRRAIGDFAGARTAFTRAITLDPDLLEARYLYSDLLARDQQLTASRESFAQLLVRDSTHVRGLIGLGGLLIDMDRPHDAIPFLNRAIARDRHSPTPHYLLARAYDQSAQVEKAQGHQMRIVPI